MDRRQGAMLAYARGLIHWHRRHRFCGRCGSPTQSRHGGHMRLCTNAECGREHFPRTDPAVIMLVTRPGLDGGPDGGPDGGAVLMGRQKSWTEGMYSTLAGFVDPGESLEEAVAREVHEEAGIAVADVTYMASQPWPFPSSLMLGFRARATSMEIHINRDELDDARWFTRDQIARFGEAGLSLPRQVSIARWLIDQWLAEGT
jgi:NAD+ diphosphatase